MSGCGFARDDKQRHDVGVVVVESLHLASKIYSVRKAMGPSTVEEILKTYGRERGTPKAGIAANSAKWEEGKV